MSSPAGYELEGQLGGGGMGTVYRARQQSSGGRLVALKRVRTPGDPDLLVRIRREAEILAALDHPHIVRVYEFVPDGHGIAIAMQYAPGGSLADRLAAEGRLDAGTVVAFATPIAQALASAHRRGVLHRDVKPGNILFTSDGEPLLSDFGIARWTHATRLTGGVPLGTAEYLAPEVADGASPDERSDVYSLGLVCYEALTGAPPYTGPTPFAVLQAMSHGAHRPLAEAAPGCPRALAEVIERAMARKPADRFASATEFAAALRHAAPATGSSPPPRPAAMAREPAGWSGASPLAPSRVPGAVPHTPSRTAPPLVRKSGPVPPVVRPTRKSGPAPVPPVVRPTRTFGPRPPAPEEPTKPSPQVPKALVWGVAVALLVLPVTIVLLLRG